MNVSEVFFQIVILLVGAILGITVPFLPRTRQKVIAGLLGVLLVLMGLVWGGVEVVGGSGSAAPTPTPTPPLVINFSPKELTDWCKRFPNAVQAEMVAEELFYGMFVRWTGDISDVKALSDKSYSAYIIAESVFFAARFQDKSYLPHLTKGNSVTVTGKIRNVCDGVLIVEATSFSAAP